MATSNVIGLDIGTTHARAVEVERARGRGTPTVVRYAEVPLPLGAVRDGEVTDSAAVADALKQLWNQGKFSRREVNLGVGNQRVLVRNLDLPWMPLSQIRASLPFQVQDILPVPVADALLDYYPTGEYTGDTGRMVTGLLVAATRDTVQANVLAAQAAGLQPVMVDLVGFALLRAHTTGELADRTVAFVDIGARITNVVVSAHGKPRLIRTLASGGLELTDAIASTMAVSAPEAEAIKRQIGIGFAVSGQLQAAAEAVNQVTQGLVESIRNTLVYDAGNNPGAAVEQIVLTGGGGYLNGIAQYLASATRLPLAIGNPLAGVKVARSARTQQLHGVESTVSVPLGLALGVAA